MRRIFRILGLAVLVALTFSVPFLAFGSEYKPHPCERSTASRLIFTGFISHPVLEAAEKARCKEQMTPAEFKAWIEHREKVARERDEELEREMFESDE